MKNQAALERVVKAFIAAGLLFMLLPGTFLGVWNLISISAQRANGTLSPAWVQAHGQAQIFGWIGSFVIGIGFFSLSKMGTVSDWMINRGKAAFVLWAAGVTLRWATGVYGWQWRVLLPLSCALMIAGFAVFFATVRQHKPAAQDPRLKVIAPPKPAWMKLVVASTAGFLLTLVWNFGIALCVAVQNIGPQYPKHADRDLLTLALWAFLIPTVWGFNSRWLPMFAGFRATHSGGAMWALKLAVASLVAAIVGQAVAAGVIGVAACGTAAWSLRIFHPAGKATDFPIEFVRVAYAWLAAGALLAVWAAAADHHNGINGASRHALTVGFLGTMIFVFGPRMLPSFCGAKKIFSQRLVIPALAILNTGCLLRVASEIPAYEGFFAPAWKVLPISAVVELTAVSLFALNLLATLSRATGREDALAQAA